jgi:two-component system, OmpR family, sensor kinase
VTLRGKLLLTSLGLVAIALVISGFVASSELQSYLLRQTDITLRAARAPVARRVTGTAPASPVPPTSTIPGSSPNSQPQSNSTRPQLISDYFIQVRAPDGTVTSQYTPTVRGDQDPLPDLPTSVVQEHIGKAPFTVGAVGHDSFKYRVIATKTASGNTLVAALSLQDSEATIDRLQRIELVVSLIVLLALGIAAWWITRVELHQLDAITDTAGAIAAGDLSIRVDTSNPRTEIGRLSEALNGMLTQIEASFAERQLSEDRLRRFAADASHELRTPLTAIRGYAELFRQGAIRDDEHLSRVLHRIESEAARMGLMVDDLMLLARLDQGRPMESEEVDIARVVTDVVHDSQVIATKRAFELNNRAARSTIRGDGARLHQVFSNLIGNALVHTPVDAAIRIDIQSTDDDVTIDVRDDGPGLPQDSADRVFERFFRVDAGRSRNSGGTGLGLAIVKSIVDAHGGTVSVTSDIGQGACFTVGFPLIQPFTGTAQG